MNLHKPLALITGAAKRVGAEIAKTLSKEGYGILLHYHQSEDEADTLIRNLNEQNPKSFHHALKADLSLEESIPAFCQTLDPFLQNIEVFVHNASAFHHDQLSCLAYDTFQANMHLHTIAPLFIAKHLAFSEQTNLKRIIFISDSGLFQPSSHFLSYSLSKSTLDLMTKMLAQELAPKILVNSIALGPTLASENQNDQQFDQLVESLLLKKPVSLVDITQALLLLIKTTSITGTTMTVDAGYCLGKSIKTPRFYKNNLSRCEKNV